MSAILLALILLSPGVLPPPEAAAHPPPTAESLKARLLAWYDSVQSFDLRYRLRSDDIEDGERRLRGHWRFEYRREGSEFHFRQETLDEAGAFVDALTYASAGGIGEFLQTYPSGNNTGIASVADMRFPPFPAGAYITPDEILGEWGGRPLRETLDGALLRVEQRGEDPVLIVERAESREVLEATFDASMQLVRLDWFAKPPKLTHEQIAALWKGDPDEVRLRRTSLVFRDWTPVGNTSFPYRVEKTWWAFDEAEQEQLNARRDRGDITQDQLWVMLHTLPTSEFIVQTFEIEAIQLNQPMAPEDFRIEWPANAELRDDATWAQLTNPNASGGGRSWHLRLWGWCVPRISEWGAAEFSLAFAALSGALALCAGGVYARRRLRHRAGHP